MEDESSTHSHSRFADARPTPPPRHLWGTSVTDGETSRVGAGARLENSLIKCHQGGGGGRGAQAGKVYIPEALLLPQLLLQTTDLPQVSLHQGPL